MYELLKMIKNLSIADFSNFETAESSPALSFFFFCESFMLIFLYLFFRSNSMRAIYSSSFSCGFIAYILKIKITEKLCKI